MATIGTLLQTWLFGKLVGEDEFGNRYYSSRAPRKNISSDLRKYKRWVVYKKDVDPTRVPAYWHGWLHHTTDEVPNRDAAMRYEWQEPNQPNPTGTVNAYLPAGHTLKGGARPVTAADYEPWNPAA
jgi:NADH:ubiquinone oxidoreductase subunit